GLAAVGAEDEDAVAVPAVPYGTGPALAGFGADGGQQHKVSPLEHAAGLAGAGAALLDDLLVEVSHGYPHNSKRLCFASKATLRNKECQRSTAPASTRRPASCCSSCRAWSGEPNAFRCRRSSSRLRSRRDTCRCWR